MCMRIYIKSLKKYCVGFALTEQGSVTLHTEVNTMYKSTIDSVFGGFAYWCFGYALAFGDWIQNRFIGFGNFFVDVYDPKVIGNTYTNFFFQVRCHK